MDFRDFPSVLSAERRSRRVDTWHIVYLSYKDPCPKISVHKSEIKLRYLNVTRAAGTAMELARIHSQLQGSSARPSHFLDAQTCEFPKNTTKSPIHENTNAKTTCDFGDVRCRIASAGLENDIFDSGSLEIREKLHK